MARNLATAASFLKGTELKEERFYDDDMDFGNPWFRCTLSKTVLPAWGCIFSQLLYRSYSNLAAYETAYENPSLTLHIDGRQVMPLSLHELVSQSIVLFSFAHAHKLRSPLPIFWRYTARPPTWTSVDVLAVLAKTPTQSIASVEHRVFRRTVTFQIVRIAVLCVREWMF